MLAERLHWSYDDIQETPEWWLKRAEVWFSERDKWVKAEIEAQRERAKSG